MTYPSNFPQPGFYYHYKHDPQGPINNYAYEFVGVGHHTEENCRPEDELMLVYRPLYKEAFVYQKGKLFDLRPLGMISEMVTKDGRTVRRFERITDPVVIEELHKIRNELYGSH